MENPLYICAKIHNSMQICYAALIFPNKWICNAILPYSKALVVSKPTGCLSLE